MTTGPAGLTVTIARLTVAWRSTSRAVIRKYQLMTCRACGAVFWISRAEYERLMYKGPLTLPAPARVVLASGSIVP